MTSWRSMTHVFFLVSLSIFPLSKQEELCKTHYFSMKELRKHLFPDRDLPDIMPFVETKDPKDMVVCTVEKAYIQNRSSMELKYLLQCITQNQTVGEDYSGSKKCQGDQSKYIPYFTFMCLVAKAVNAPPEELEDQGCEKELFCPVSPTATTTMQPTTTPERTTAHPTEMRPPSPQPLTTTTKTTTGAAATLSQSPTTPSNGRKDKIDSDKPDNCTDFYTAQVGLLTVLVLLSLCANVGLIVCLCRRQYGPRPSNGTNELNPTPPGNQLSSTPLPSVNGESVETSPFFQETKTLLKKKNQEKTPTNQRSFFSQQTDRKVDSAESTSLEQSSLMVTQFNILC